MMSPETPREKIHRKADYILYSLETGLGNWESLDNAMTVIRQIGSSPLVDAATAEWDLWTEDRRRCSRAVRAWNEATFGPILYALRPGELLPENAFPDWSFAEFRATPEGTRLHEAKEEAVRALHAPRERLKIALRELVAATAPPPA